MQLVSATSLRPASGKCFMLWHAKFSPAACSVLQPALKGPLCLRTRRHINKSHRPRRLRSASRSDNSPEGTFQEELLSATRRFQALEEYRQLLRQGPAEIDLFQAALLIAKHRYPLLDEAQCNNEMSQLVAAVQASLPSTSDQPGFELVYITRHLGQVAGFKGNDKDYYNPDNSCINMVLQDHTGIPITLGLLYMGVAQRLGLQLHGLNLPGRFMLGNTTEGVTNLLVDPFDGFKLCSLTDVEEMFAKGYNYKLTLSTALVTRSQLVMSTPTVLVRILSNLKNIYTGLQQADKVLQITDYLRATRDVAEDIRDAGLCLFSVQRYADSAELLQQYLEHNPAAQDRPQTEAVLNRIYKLLQKPSL